MFSVHNKLKTARPPQYNILYYTVGILYEYKSMLIRQCGIVGTFLIKMNRFKIQNYNKMLLTYSITICINIHGGYYRKNNK